MSSSIRLALILLAVALLCHCSDNPTKPNSPPVLSLVSSKSVEVGQTLAFTIMATDPDGTVPTIRAMNPPTHADFTDGKDGTGLFSFVPDTSQAGQYDVVFVASDGELADSETVVILVNPAGNHRPVLIPIAPASCEATTSLSFIIAAVDSDGTIPTLTVYDLPPNAIFVDSANGRGGFAFNPDSTQIGVFESIFVASDGELADSESVQITVTPHEKSVGELWPMAVGNYWVYETKRRSQSEWTLDSIHVQSSYQSEGVTHWRLSGNGFLFIGNDIAVRNDSIIGIHHKIAQPAVWPDRADTVPAGIFEPTYEDCQEIFSLYGECLVFAKDVGVIGYEWIYLSAHYPSWYDARLVRYFVK